MSRSIITQGDVDREKAAARASTEDPYFNTDRCVDRLMATYEKRPRLIVAFDFDDTVFDFHRKDHTFPKVVQLLRDCQQLGFYIVLFTASAKARHAEMKAYLEGLGIKVDAINENPIELPYGKEGKVFYNILLDDRAGLAQAYEILRAVVDIIFVKKMTEGEEKRDIDRARAYR